MFKKSLFVVASVIVACFLGMDSFVNAQAQCPGRTTLSLATGANGASGTTSAAVCYRLSDIPLSTGLQHVSVTAVVYVKSGRVNVYGAASDTSTVSQRLNASEITAGAGKTFVLNSGSSSVYTLGILPLDESTFTLSVSAPVEDPTPEPLAVKTAEPVVVDPLPPDCTPVEGINPCSPGTPMCIDGYVLRAAVAGDDICVTTDVWEQVLYDNSQASQRIDPTNLSAPDACIEGYVWRLATPGDHVCVTPDVWIQTANDNRLAPTRWLIPLPANPPAEGGVFAPTNSLWDGIITGMTGSPLTASTFVSCPNSLTPRLTIGGSGRMTLDDPNALLVQPELEAAKIGIIDVSASLLILDGPVCADNLNWWKVEYNGLEGWTAEGGSGIYWLEPTGP